MKKIYPFFLAILCTASSYSQDILTGQKATAVAPGSELVRTSRFSTIPDYILFRTGSEITPEQVLPYLQEHFQLNASCSFALLTSTPDRIGFTHYRYQETFNGVPLDGTMYNVHVKNGKVASMNGMIFPSVSEASSGISENDALQDALQYVNATQYRWQDPQDELRLKMMTKNPEATWYPKGVLTYAADGGAYSDQNYKLTYCFDVYASQPLSRQYIYVDAQSGKIVLTRNRIQNEIPVNGTAVTGYSGTKTIVVDSEAVNTFYLHDILRGGGVFTYNLHQSTNYASATEFSDADNMWDNANTQKDQYATDAHFGLEKTYDLYDSVYNRNSLDDDGLAFYAYVHYDQNYFNAFWDGTEMTFGDGSGFNINPLTTLDITGHEVTHGLTQYTCNLDYNGEPGGLNESFSDLAGEMVEHMGKGTNDWLIGAEIGEVIRYFENPSQDGASASTYGDNYWNNNTDVHYWSGPQNHWFYILSVGDTATNDLGTPYSVQGIGMTDAHAIAYRNQTIYLVPSSDYADARFYAIQSAKDLFGGCSPQDISCTNAWYAVGVGNAFVADVISAFEASTTSLCSLNTTVYFSNLSNNGENYTWNFGDGTTSTDVNPNHQYTSEGTYTISLYTDGGNCGTDSLEQVDYITVALPTLPIAFDTTTCANSPAVLVGIANGTITWYDVPTGGVPVGTGSPYITDPVPVSTVFYAENDEGSPIQSAGAPSNNFGTGGYFTNTNSHFLFFDAYDDFTLQKVTVYSNTTATRTIILLDNAGNLVHSTTQTIASGTQTITLNFSVTAGTGYQLGLQNGSTAELYRNQSGATYPYTLGGVLSITGNDAGPGYYYYFYNWQVQKANCTSIRIPVKVMVLPTPAASFTYNAASTLVTFTNGSTNALSYQWNFGDGFTSALSDPQHDFGTLGNYTVQLIAFNGICSDTFTQVISMLTGIDGVNSEYAVSVSPNPFENYLQVDYSSANAGTVNIKLTDVLGRELLSEDKNFLAGNQLLKLNTDQLSSGIYFIKVEGNGGLQTFKVVKR